MFSVTQSRPTPCNPMDCSPPGFSVHGIFPGKNTGVGCHFLLQGLFPTQGSNLHLLHLLQGQADSLPLSHPQEERPLSRAEPRSHRRGRPRDCLGKGTLCVSHVGSRQEDLSLQGPGSGLGSAQREETQMAKCAKNDGRFLAGRSLGGLGSKKPSESQLFLTRCFTTLSPSLQIF